MPSKYEELTKVEESLVQSETERNPSAVTALFRINFKARSNAYEYVTVPSKGCEACV